MEITEILSNPVRVRVVQYMQLHSRATTKQIAEALRDIPAPTLYRHIDVLLKEQVLLVTEERKVRGGTERILTVNAQKFAEAERGNLADAAYHFFMNLYGNFYRYGQRGDGDPLRDRLSLRTRMLALSDEEFDGLMGEMASLLNKYDNKELNAERKMRSLSFVSAPVEEIERRSE